MRKLIIDLNSVLSASLLVGKDPEGFKVGKKQVNTWEYGYNIFLNSYRNIIDEFELYPMHTVGVFDAPKSRDKRQRIYPDYKAHREPQPEEYYEQFNTLMKKTKQFLRHLGGCIVSCPKTEADDVIAHIAPKLDSMIWTRDKDLLSIDAPVYIDKQLNFGPVCQDHFIQGMPRNFIRLYRALVSDPGDFGPGMGADGFGHKTFAKLWAEFGDEGLQNLADIIEEDVFEELEEDVASFPALQKIINSRKNVRLTWRLARWMKIKDHKLVWEPGFTHGTDCESFDENFFEFYQEITLVDVANFDEAARHIRVMAGESDYIALDLETDVGEKSNEWLAKIKENFSRPPITVDVIESKIVGLGLTLGRNLECTYYISINHADTMNVTTESVKELVLSLDKPFIIQNAGGFELPVIYLNWGVWLPDVHCSMIASTYVDENRFSHSLKLLSKDYFHYQQQSYMDVTGGKGMSELSAEHVLSYGADDTIMGGHLFNFFEMVMDVEGTFDVYAEVEQYPMYMVAHSFAHGIDWDPEYLSALAAKDKAEADKAMVIIHDYLCALEWAGTVFEPLTELTAAEIKRGYAVLYGEPLKTRFRLVEKIAGQIEDKEFAGFLLADDLDGLNTYLKDQFVPRPDFNPGSTVDKKALFYDTFAFEKRFRKQVTDNQRELGQTEGNLVVDEDAIKWMIQEDADEEQRKLLRALLRWQAYSTRDGLYYKPYPLLAHWRTGKLHPSLRQSATTSRRFAPSGPNVNQVPKRSEEGKKVRGAYVPHHKDAVLVAPDFTGQELRVGAEETQDKNFLACYVGDELKDLHTVTAFEICKKQGKEFDTYKDLAMALYDPAHPKHKLAKAYRTAKAKPTNFLSQYVSKGGGDYTLSKKLQITTDEATAFLEAKSLAFPGVDEWKDEYGLKVMSQGFAETFLGARKHTGALIARMGGASDHIMRSALNFRIQSSSAEMTKLVIAEVWRQGLLDTYDSRFYMPVHDEVVFSVMLDDLVEFVQDLYPIMTQPYADMSVPILSSLSVGRNFAELDEIGWEEAEVKSWIASYRR